MLSFATLLFPLLVTSASNPRFVSYIDKIEGWWPDTDILKAWGTPGYSATYSYNVLNLAFLQSSVEPTDALDPWVSPSQFFSTATMQNITGSADPTDDEFRTALKELYEAAGVKLMVSCFGAGDYPTKTNDPVSLGEAIAAFVTEYQFDGVDIDWEDSSAFESGDGTGEYWLSNLTSTMRSVLGESYIITHAPQAPYFMGANMYKAGGYLYVDNEVGDDISWYNVQFYNQGTSEYTTYDTLFVTSDGWSTNSSVYQMINGDNDLNIKISSDKIVVGKPVTQSDADNTGYVASDTLKSIFSQAVSDSNTAWNVGFMDWQFSSDMDESFSFANTVAAAWN